ncbi:MAG TPA: hypothetical protein VL354_15480 [Spirochaetia bacterium]|nr:hypothetical protein [Spirochaetia bacterium]
MKRFLAVAAVLGVMLVVLAGCPAASSGGATYTLSGSVATPTGATVDNTMYVYLKLVTNGGSSTSTALYWTRAQFSGGTANYSISGISTGTYTGWAFIDIKHTYDANPSSSVQPVSGDYGTQSPGATITISGNQTENLDSSSMTLVP